jgi:hypothetical protein
MAMRLGNLSAKYESNGDPGTVSTGWGDAGGVSYGTYQLSSTAGSAASFVRWLRNQNHPAGNILGQHDPGSREFSAAWKYCAANITEFGDLQHDYIKYAYYDTAVESLRVEGFNVENHHPVMADVIWSRAVQYGSYIVEMFETAALAIGYPNLSYVDALNFDADMIRAIYLDVCKTPEWTNGSPALRDGLYSRFESECQDALNILGGI